MAGAIVGKVKKRAWGALQWKRKMNRSENNGPENEKCKKLAKDPTWIISAACYDLIEKE